MRTLLTINQSVEITTKLREPSIPIQDIGLWTKGLAEEMLSQLTPLKAVGLAAPQFGENVQLFVMNLRGVRLIMINPVIMKEKGSHRVSEGCTSIPGKLYKVYRPKKVKVQGLNLEGKQISFSEHDLMAQVLCHEIDHLNGILIDNKGGAKQCMI